MSALWTARDYQLPALQRLVEGAKRNVWVWHRRSGKDLTAWNWTILSALSKVSGYYYFLPTREQAKKVIWNNFTREGVRFTKFIPSEYIKKVNENDLRIEFTNGSMIQLMGADNFDGNVGMSFGGAVFSEYSVMSDLGWQYMEPIAVESGAWVIFVYTPRGQNHGWKMYQTAQAEIAEGNKNWACFYYPVTATDAMDGVALAESRRTATDLRRWEQEYYCLWTTLNSGAVFANQCENVVNDGRFTATPHDPLLPVYTSWDVGVADPTAVWFWQKGPTTMRLIDYYEGNQSGLEYHVREILSRPYNYAGHFFPHDMKVRDLGFGYQRISLAEDFGLKDCVIVPKLAKEDQFEHARVVLPVCYFDVSRAADGFDKLSKYGYKFNENETTYSKQPKDNENSHAADAFMVGAVAQQQGYMTNDRDPERPIEVAWQTDRRTHPEYSNPYQGYSPTAHLPRVIQSTSPFRR